MDVSIRERSEALIERSVQYLGRVLGEREVGTGEEALGKGRSDAFDSCGCELRPYEKLLVDRMFYSRGCKVHLLEGSGEEKGVTTIVCSATSG